MITLVKILLIQTNRARNNYLDPADAHPGTSQFPDYSSRVAKLRPVKRDRCIGIQVSWPHHQGRLPPPHPLGKHQDQMSLISTRLVPYLKTCSMYSD